METKRINITEKSAKIYQNSFKRVDAKKYGSTYIVDRKQMDNFLRTEKEKLGWLEFGDVCFFEMFSQLQEAEIRLKNNTRIILDFD